MGGRGSSSGGRTLKDGTHLPYGSEYTTVLQSGNIKFVKANSGSATAPLETMTKGRVYVTLGSDGEPRYISHYDSNNKKFKQIDIAGKPHPVDGAYILPHTHKGYIHDERGTFALTEDEKKMVAKVRKIWYNRRSK